MSEKFTLISSLEPLKVGDEYELWPLHVTAMPWFSLPEDSLAPFDNTLRNLMHDFEPMTLVGDDEAMFGPEDAREVRVRTLRKIGAFAKLHASIQEVLRQYGGETISPFVGDLFIPHVTFQGQSGIEQDEEITLEGLNLVSGDIEGARRVRKQYRFMKGQPKHG